MGMRQSPHGLSAVVEILFPSGAVVPPSRKEEIEQAVVNEHVTTRQQLDFLPATRCQCDNSERPRRRMRHRRL